MYLDELLIIVFKWCTVYSGVQFTFRHSRFLGLLILPPTTAVSASPLLYHFIDGLLESETLEYAYVVLL